MVDSKDAGIITARIRRRIIHKLQLVDSKEILQIGVNILGTDDQDVIRLFKLQDNRDTPIFRYNGKLISAEEYSELASELGCELECKGDVFLSRDERLWLNARRKHFPL